MTERPPSPQAPEVERPARVGAEARQEHPPSVTSPAKPELRTIFEAECTYVFHTLRRLGVHERDLEDVAHDVFLTVHRKLDEYDPSRPLRPWLFAFAYRYASDYRKLARHRRETLPGDSGAPEAIDASEAPDARLESARRRRLVLDALEQIELDQRAVFVMHEIDGTAIPAVAAALSIPLNTAYSRLRLAREKFAVAVRQLSARQTADARTRREQSALRAKEGR